MLSFPFRTVTLMEQIDASRAKRPERLPVVLTRDEVRAVLGQLSGVHSPLDRL